MKERTSTEWIEIARREGRQGKTYVWTTIGGKAVKSTDYHLLDGTVIGIPHTSGHGVEVRYPDGGREYPLSH